MMMRLTSILSFLTSSHPPLLSSPRPCEPPTKKEGAEEDKIKRLGERSVKEIQEMRNQFNHHLHHKSTFLPILCSRPCIKDVAIPNSASSSSDPLSPRVGCMGQVKRNNRVVGFPTFHRLTATATATATTAAARNANSVKYSKLKKFFSSKNLVATPGSSISGSRRELIVGGRRGSSKIDCHEDENYASVINVVDLDPPLPVIKRVQQRGDGADSESLWKRRSGGVALKTLQLQPLHLPPQSLQPTTV